MTQTIAQLHLKSNNILNAMGNFGNDWRATVDEGGHYSFAVAL